MPAAKRRDPSARLGMPPRSQNRSGGDMRRFVKSKDVEKKPQAWAVGLDKWTLSFSNSALDGEWRRLVAGRSRALWLRSLLSATLYQALRHAADAAQFGPAPQWVVAVRLVLAVSEILLFAAAYCDLLRPSQAAIAANAFLYGIVELALVVDRLRPRVAPGDWLHVRDAASSTLTPSSATVYVASMAWGTGADAVDARWRGGWRASHARLTVRTTQVTYGLAWFIVPKMSALQFFPACLGSCAIVGWWSLLSLATMAAPPEGARYGVGGDLWRLVRRWAPFTTPVRASSCTGVDCVQRTLAALEESSVVRRTSWQDASAGLALVVPVVVLFNVVAYSSEKSVKERFVLRSALAHEHRHDVRLSLLGDDASQMLSRLQDAVKAPRFRPPEQRTDRLLLAAIPAVLLAASGYFPSIPSFTGSLASSAFGGPDAAWAALSHVFGLSLFLLVLTKRVKFLLLTPLVVAALFYLAAQTLVETDSRTKLFRWAGSVVLAAFVLGAFRVARLFAALLHFARRTLFLYPHLEENLKEHSDGEVLGRLVAKVELPRPNNPGAVRGALDTQHQNEGESEQSLCSLGSYKSEESHDGPLPVLPLGSHDRACAFCSHDPGGTSCSATHAVPVCGAWASWYLWRAERAKRINRARNEVSSPVDEGPSLRPCCDFATLALERSALQRENASLRAQIASLRARERPPPSSPPEAQRPLELAAPISHANSRRERCPERPTSIKTAAAALILGLGLGCAAAGLPGDAAAGQPLEKRLGQPLEKRLGQPLEKQFERARRLSADACATETTTFSTCLADASITFTPATPAGPWASCDDVQAEVTGICDAGPAACEVEYHTYTECLYEYILTSTYGAGCDLTCASSTRTPAPTPADFQDLDGDGAKLCGNQNFTARSC